MAVFVFTSICKLPLNSESTFTVRYLVDWTGAHRGGVMQNSHTVEGNGALTYFTFTF